jgi:hypothetical protein
MTEEKKNKLINKIGRYIKLLVSVSVSICVIFSAVFIISKVRENSSKIEKIRTSESNSGDILANRVKQLENTVSLMRSNIGVLESEIIKLQNQNPINNEKNIQIVILLNKILNTVYKGGDFSENIRYIKELSKSRTDIFEKVVKLEKFKVQQNQKDLRTVFVSEYKNISKIDENEKNKIKKFIDDNIKIRKIDKIEENSNDNIIFDIENSINNFKYEEAIKIINDNNYSGNFTKTLEILIQKYETIVIIDDIINFIFIN